MVSKIPTARYLHINAVIRKRAVRAWQQQEAARVDVHAHFKGVLVRLVVTYCYHLSIETYTILSDSTLKLSINGIIFIFYSFQFFTAPTNHGKTHFYGHGKPFTSLSFFISILPA